MKLRNNMFPFPSFLPGMTDILFIANNANS